MKIRIRKHINISIKECSFFVAMFCVFTFALLEHMSIPIPNFSAYKNPLLYTAGCCILLNCGSLLKVLRKKKHFYVISSLIVLTLFLIASVVFAKTIDRGVVQRSTIRLLLYLYELFFLMIWASENKRSQYTIKFLLYYILAVVIVNDILLFTQIIIFGTSDYPYYLVGTKFNVAYFHINLLTVWFIYKKQKLLTDKRTKRIMFYGFFLVLYLSIYVDCVTGIFGGILMLTMFMLINTDTTKQLVRLNSPVWFVSVVIASVLFPFLAETMVSIPVITDFIQNVLNRNANLTGRLNIYTSFMMRMEGHWLWGYGYGNANAVSKEMFGYANVQNGLLQWVLQIGVLGTIMLVVLMLTILRVVNKYGATKKCLPLIILIYLYMLLGMIEITMDMSFILWFALLFLFSTEPMEKDQKTKVELRPSEVPLQRSMRMKGGYE